MLPRHELEHLATAAKVWREAHALKEPQLAASGWVFFYQGKIMGWGSALEPKRWRPGVLALGVAGLAGSIFYACEGDAQGGAKEFAELDRGACGLAGKDTHGTV